MRVLHVYKTYYPDTYGGIEQVIYQLSQGCARRGIAADVFTFSPDKETGPVAYEDHRVIYNKQLFEIASTPFSLKALKRFKQIKDDYDIINYHFPFPFMDMLHLSARPDARTVVTYHSDIVKQKRLMKLYQPLQERFLASVDCIVASSPNYVASSQTLKKYQDKSFIAVDSAVITDGTFKFEGVCTEPLAYGLTTFRDSKRPLVFFLDNEKMQLKMNESEKILTVTGSAINDLYAQNAPLTRQDGYSIDSLVAVHPASAVTPYFIVKDFAYKLNLEEMKALRAKLDASLDETMYVSQIDGFIKRMEDIQVGAVAPDFTLPDVDGNPVTLSGLRGKYVLIDFWASWCPDCRKENPNIVAAWNKYKDKNFTILGVSLDRKKEPWLAAIEKDQLAWTHVSDLKDWKSDAAVQYAIRWIPMNFLLDPNGVILAVGLEGEALQQKLDEVLK